MTEMKWFFFFGIWEEERDFLIFESEPTNHEKTEFESTQEEVVTAGRGEFYTDGDTCLLNILITSKNGHIELCFPLLHLHK